MAGADPADYFIVLAYSQGQWSQSLATMLMFYCVTDMNFCAKNVFSVCSPKYDSTNRTHIGTNFVFGLCLVFFCCWKTSLISYASKPCLMCIQALVALPLDDAFLFGRRTPMPANLAGGLFC